MPDKRCHRGPDPEDDELFAPVVWPTLRKATSDLCWLLDHDYAMASSVELVGNRFNLARRQRVAIARCACSNEARQRRRQHQVEPDQLRGQELWLDGYNVLTAVESALAGGVILLGNDGCCRDMAGVHARYRRVNETIPALSLIGELTAQWGVTECHWWLDRPISNSGRLKQLILKTAADSGWSWQVELVYNPDKVLSETDRTIASSDSVILDRCQRWINLARTVIALRVPQARLVDLDISSHSSPLQGNPSD
ncbi:MAG: DUF434 domain-containing protein [Candidatus Omnitrophica bacterium]|nr:DUF434 domain-containing protein [Candidatus Omnitrophota bacterium]